MTNNYYKPLISRLALVGLLGVGAGCATSRTSYNSNLQGAVKNATYSPSLALSAGNNGGVRVGVNVRYGTWKDFFTSFRPSCWENPLEQGGSLCELNYKNWGDKPSVPAKSLAGKLLIFGTGYAISESFGGSDNDKNSSQPAVNNTSGARSTSTERNPPVTPPQPPQPPAESDGDGNSVGY